MWALDEQVRPVVTIARPWPCEVAIARLSRNPTLAPRRQINDMAETGANTAMVGAGTDKTKAPVGGGPAIILVRPQLAVNIGMCARAMANFGLDDLRLVNPKAGWPRTDEYREIAYSAAAGATQLLDAARVFASVEAAVGDLQFVYAATARERGQMKDVLTPALGMAETASVAQKRGVLFGPERTGLENDEVALADAILTFPT